MQFFSKYLVLVAIFLLTTTVTCTKTRKNDSDLDAGQRADSGGGMFQSVRDLVLPRGLEVQQSDPTWPKMPRRDFEHKRVSKIARTATVGLSVKDLNLDFGADIGSHFILDFQQQTTITTLILANNDPEKNETVFVRQDSQVRLNYWEGRDMVIACLVSSQYATGREWENKIRFFVAGGTENRSYQELATVTQISKFRRPKIGETDLQAIQYCNSEFYSEKLQASIRKDLDAAMEHMFIHAPGIQCVEDKDCANSTWGPMAEWTTPRCIRYQNGNFFCGFRGKEGLECPVWGPKDKNGERELLTDGTFEYPCDEKAGLSCVQTSPGWSLDFSELGWDYKMRITSAKAECKKTSTALAKD